MVKEKAKEETTEVETPDVEIEEHEGDESNDDFDAGFQEFEGDDAPDSDTTTADGEDDPVNGEDADEGEGEGEEGEGNEDSKEQETAVERLNRIAAETAEKKPENKKQEPPPPPKKEDPPPAKDPDKPKDSPKQKSIDDLIEERIPEQDKARVKELLEEWDDLKVLLSALTIPQQETAAVEKKNAPPPQIDPDTARARLLYECERKHKGSIEIAESPEFQKWLEEQPETIQTLADSGDLDSSVTIIQAYQETKAKSAAKKHDESTSGLRSKKAALHKSTAKPKGAKQSQSGGGTDDFDSAFDEFADKDD